MIQHDVFLFVKVDDSNFCFFFFFFWSASINAIACPFGGLLCSYILDKYGRKKTLYTINAISILSWGLMAMASTTDKQTMFIQLLIARLLIGKWNALKSIYISLHFPFRFE